MSTSTRSMSDSVDCKANIDKDNNKEKLAMNGNKEQKVCITLVIEQQNLLLIIRVAYRSENSSNIIKEFSAMYQKRICTMAIENIIPTMLQKRN